MTDVKVKNLGGVKMLYDRSSAADYGVGGVPFTPNMNQAFAQECDKAFKDMFDEMQKHTGLKPKLILSGGVSRAGSGKSLHHKNRAFDLDGLLFEDGTNWVANTFPQRRQIYLGMEAVLRRYFGVVLAYDYNRAHEDHFHFDDGLAPGLSTRAKSHVIFLQNVVTFVYHTPVGRDGVWGSETSEAVVTVRRELGIGGLSELANWKQFLSRVAVDAFKNEAGRVGDVVIPEPEVCHCCGQVIPA